MTLIAVDPGVHMSGVAMFDNGKLTRAAWWQSEMVAFDSAHSSELYIEVPRIYPGNHSKVDLNDLLDLSLAAGWMIGRSDHLKHTRIYPADWKRQVPKLQMVERIKGFLTPDELKRVEVPSAKSKQHNVWDAVGIGLFAVGRMKPGGAR